MIKKSIPDKQKAKSLKEMALITLERLQGTDLYKYSANTLTDFYDVTHKLMEALASIEGIKTKGEGAHQELIDYICKNYNFEESTRIFLQEMRDFRNRISYEGFLVAEDYITTNIEKINAIIGRLRDLIKV